MHTPWQEWLMELHRLHEVAGYPSVRDIATGREVSYNTVSQTLNGHRLPRWKAAEQIVTALDPKAVDAAHELWKAAWAERYGSRTQGRVPMPHDSALSEQIAQVQDTLDEILKMMKENAS
jgi:hypothetical protein